MSEIQTIQFKRGTESEWTDKNPILEDAELGYNKTNKKFKIGNGKANWNDLEYYLEKEVGKGIGKAYVSDGKILLELLDKSHIEVEGFSTADENTIEAFQRLLAENKELIEYILRIHTHDYSKLENLPTFKTINNQSILGIGNITITGGVGSVDSVNGKTGGVVLSPDDMDDSISVKKFTNTSEKTSWNNKENGFSKNTAFNKNFGNTAGTVTEGNDERLSNAREPLPHNHDSSYYTKSEVDNKVSAVYKYKGTKATYTELPTADRIIGDVWNVLDSGINYAWDGTGWDDIGGVEALATLTNNGLLNKEDFALIRALENHTHSYDDLDDKPEFKTINNESILGTGNITIEGGTGEVTKSFTLGEPLNVGTVVSLTTENKLRKLIYSDTDVGENKEFYPNNVSWFSTAKINDVLYAYIYIEGADSYCGTASMDVEGNFTINTRILTTTKNANQWISEVKVLLPSPNKVLFVFNVSGPEGSVRIRQAAVSGVSLIFQDVISTYQWNDQISLQAIGCPTVAQANTVFLYHNKVCVSVNTSGTQATYDKRDFADDSSLTEQNATTSMAFLGTHTILFRKCTSSGNGSINTKGIMYNTFNSVSEGSRYPSGGVSFETSDYLVNSPLVACKVRDGVGMCFYYNAAQTNIIAKVVGGTRVVVGQGSFERFAALNLSDNNVLFLFIDSSNLNRLSGIFLTITSDTVINLGRKFVIDTSGSLPSASVLSNGEILISYTKNNKAINSIYKEITVDNIKSRIGILQESGELDAIKQVKLFGQISTVHSNLEIGVIYYFNPETNTFNKDKIGIPIGVALSATEMLILDRESAQSFKTVNGQSLLGEGNITIDAGQVDLSNERLNNHLTVNFTTTTINSWNEVLSGVPANLNGFTLTIQLGNGVYNISSTLTLPKRFFGGLLIIQGDPTQTGLITNHNVCLRQTSSHTRILTISNILCPVRIYRIRFEHAGTNDQWSDNFLRIEDCEFAQIWCCHFKSANRNSYLIASYRVTNLLIQDVYLEGGNLGLYASSSCGYLIGCASVESYKPSYSVALWSSLFTANNFSNNNLYGDAMRYWLHEGSQVHTS